MENVRIYEVKESAQDNYETLRSMSDRRFYWNENVFANNVVGDYVFVINKSAGEGLFTRLAEKGLEATHDERYNYSNFRDDTTNLHVRGKWDRFARFDILDFKEISFDWEWKSLGNSEVYDLWKTDEELAGQVKRIERIRDLEKLWVDGWARAVLQTCADLLFGGSLLPEITEVLQQPAIQDLIQAQEFVFQKARDTLDELNNFRPSSNDYFYNNLLAAYSGDKEKSFLEFLAGFPPDSEEYKLLRIIGELISYCDTNAAGKKEFNRYPDKRTMARATVRQPIWVQTLLQYKARDCDIDTISSPTIQNAIYYLRYPEKGMTMLSEDHRKMTARGLLLKDYDKSAFVGDVRRFFEPYFIRPVHPFNLTQILSHVLYADNVKDLWFGKMEGLVVADATGWQENAIGELQECSKIVLWWSKVPSGGLVIQKLLRQQIRERKFFFIYYCEGGEAYYRARVIDFSLKEEYATKDWNAGADVARYHPDFDKYEDENKKARIVFLSDEFIELDTPIPYERFVFYKNFKPPVHNNMQPYSEVVDEAEEEPDYEQPIERLISKTREKDPEEITISERVDTVNWDHEHRQILMAMKTKPFILLAGISGIGKSRLVRALAYKTCAIEQLRKENPLNFHLIKVRPNWYDSTELLGYESTISGRGEYKITSFIKFLVRAAVYPQIPFFLCMDEMNLAPVELYLAEYLSAIESRRYWKEEVVTDPLLPPEVFKKFGGDTQFWKELGIYGRPIQQTLVERGLCIPSNLIVIGTVNMDETTHSFSRKVLDRAMTIEMNEVRLREKLVAGNPDWDYPSPAIFYSRELVCGNYLSPGDIPDTFNERKEKLLDLLVEVNGVLENTPFKIAYRVRDESLLYCYYHSLLDGDRTPLTKVLDEIIRMKILSRIEGDETKCRPALEGLSEIFRREDLRGCIAKVDEMLGRLENGYTSFFW